MNIKFKARNVLMVFLIIFISVLTVGTYAYFTSSDEVTNTIIIGDVDIEVDEEFTPPKNWDGKEYDKKVQIKNNSKVNALIRIAIVPRWIDESGNAWPGDTEVVNLNYEIANIINNANTTPQDKWVYGGDGYYYYNSIVLTGNNTSKILNSVSLDFSDMPEQLQEMYEGKTLIVDVKSEAIQATKDAYIETWRNVSDEIKNMLDNICLR